MTKKFEKTQNQILAENEDLRVQLDEARETLRAIRSGEVDAITVSGVEGEQLFTLTGADQTYRKLIEDMSEGALTLTDAGMILFSNKRFAEMLKTPLEKVIGTTIHNWIATESLPALQSLLRKKSGKKSREQLVLKAGDGPVPVLLSMSRLLIKGMPDSFCIVATDLTEQKHSDKIAASEKLAQELLAASNESRLALLSMIEDQKRVEEALRESEQRFRSLFEDSPVSLWEEDFSAVKPRLDALKSEGVTDLHAYLKSHPEEVVKCASLIKVLDVNITALKMYGARDKEHLIDNLVQIVNFESSGNFIDELVNISNGLMRFDYETAEQSIGGRKINSSLSWTAAPGHEKDLSRVLISIVDITERKEAEAKMEQLITELRDLSEMEKKNRILAEALAKNVSVINSSLKAEEVMDSIIDTISEIVPYDAASVMMVKGQQARIVRSKGYQERGLEKWVEQAQFDLNKIKDFNSIIRNKKYIVTPNTETCKDWTVVAETAWVKSHITSPLMENNQVIGFLNLDSATPGFYSEDHAKELMSFSEQVSTALKNARQFEETQRRMDRMQAMTQIDLAINSSLDINVSLEIVLIQAKDKLNADAVDILQVNKGTNSLVFSKAKGFKTDEIRKANFRLGTGLPGRAVLERALIAIPDLRSAPESYFRSLLVEREGFASYYCAPLITKGELKGVMEIYFREPYQAEQEWKEFLEMLAQQTAIAINNAELLNSLKASNADLMNAYETTLKGWVDALDLRDHETEGHSLRVTELSLQLALRMGIKDSEIVNFKRGALLHDIGKVGVPDSILKKPGPLTDEEWITMRQHPLHAFQLLSKSKYLIPALDIPYCHHEKWDGSGYPRGLKGEAIPLAARIFAIVDVWDALISDRPYRKAWTQKQALDHIQEQSGKHFDPKVVSAFMALPKKGIN